MCFGKISTTLINSISIKRTKRIFDTSFALSKLHHLHRVYVLGVFTNISTTVKDITCTSILGGQVNEDTFIFAGIRILGSSSGQKIPVLKIISHPDFNQDFNFSFGGPLQNTSSWKIDQSVKDKAKGRVSQFFLPF